MNKTSEAIKKAKQDILIYAGAAIGRITASKQRYASGGGGIIVNVVCWLKHSDFCTTWLHNFVKSHFERRLKDVEFSWNGTSIHITYRDADGKMLHPKEGSQIGLR